MYLYVYIRTSLSFAAVFLYLSINDYNKVMQKTVGKTRTQFSCEIRLNSKTNTTETNQNKTTRTKLGCEAVHHAA